MTTSPSLSLRQRRNRIIRFFARALISALFWDVLVRSLGGRRIAQHTALNRYVLLARRFRQLAVDMGGVLIKLGQFISSRVDVLPMEITNELAGLQDEVPPAPFDAVRAVIESELGQPLGEAFAAFDAQPIAAASLGQAHRATLPDGTSIIVKVQRPGIEALIAIDLDALRWPLGWLKRFRAIRRRANLDALFEEFKTTLLDEIDYLAEGRNAERFAADFAAWETIRIPRIHWPQCTRRVLAMEDISAIKITEVAAFEAQGVKRQAVAKTLFEFYLHQMFTLGFFHADPHPGNLFVEPRDEGRFTLNVVDFGMVGRITPDVRANLREAFIGIALRDVHRVVQAMRAAGWLLPSADLREIERAADKALSSFWGIRMGQLRELDLNEVRGMLVEFRELLYELPFQIPANMLFLGRALGILSGLVTSIDPDFSVFEAAEPFARQMVADEGGSLLSSLWSQATQIGGAVARLPVQTDRLLSTLLRGELRISVAELEPLLREIQVLQALFRRLVATVVFAGITVIALVMSLTGQGQYSGWLIVAAIIALVWLSTRR